MKRSDIMKSSSAIDEPVTLQSRVYKVGLTPYNFQPLIDPCVASLTSWKPPLPKTCRQPGILVEIFDLIARRVGLNYSIVILDEFQGGSSDEYGNFDGQIGIVQRGEIDIAVTLVEHSDIVTRAGNAVVSLLRPMTVARSVIVVPSVEETTLLDHAFKPLSPFNMSLWLMFFATFGVICLLRKFSGRNVQFCSKLILTVCAIALNLHFLNLYKASVVSSYLIKRPTPRIATFKQIVEELEAGNVKLIMPTEEYYLDLAKFFLHNSISPQSSAWERFALAMKENPPLFSNSNQTLSINMWTTENAYRFAFDEAEVANMLAHDCNLRLIPVPYADGGNMYPSMIANPNETELVRVLNEAMDKLNIRILYQKIKEKYDRESMRLKENCTWHAEYNNARQNPVTIRNLTGILIIFGATVILSGIVFTAELFS